MFMSKNDREFYRTLKNVHVLCTNEITKSFVKLIEVLDMSEEDKALVLHGYDTAIINAFNAGRIEEKLS